MPDIASVNRVLAVRCNDVVTGATWNECATLTDLCDLIENGSEEEKRRFDKLLISMGFAKSNFRPTKGTTSQGPITCARCNVPIVGSPGEPECER